MSLLPREQFWQVLSIEQICQWLKDLGNFGQKLAIKVHHAHKPLQIHDSVWPGKIKHDLQTVPERGDAGGAEVVVKEVELQHRELALVKVDGKPRGGRAAHSRHDSQVAICELGIIIVS
jgi:hypothetical protein